VGSAMSCEAKFRCTLGLSLVMVAFSVCLAHASATLLLEEPYGELGFFTATGHAAVYLSGVCAETPLKLRPCAPGELGAVISRYDGVGGYDWAAIPLIPYLYAVEHTEDIPLFVDPKVVSFLRDQYRRKHLEGVAPDVKNGETPGGNWYELVGSAYDRASYAFEIETSSEQDRAFITAYNLSANESHFHTVSRNCADFAKDVINFYYPKALHRSVVADIGITTPKQMAKTIVKYSVRHPRLEFSRYVIPQVPGSEARSTPVHGVVESFFKSKKYIVPSAVVSPVFAGSVAAVYVGTVAGRFDPARNSLVYNADRGLEPPIGVEDRRSYELELNHLLAEDPSEPGRVEKNLGRTMNSASPGFDSEGHPVLLVQMGDAAMTVGMVPGNIFASDSSHKFAQQILEARLREELRRGNAPKVSETDVEHDWALLQEALHVSADEELASRSAKPLSANWPLRWIHSGNRP
jgi:hypothetical protein